MCGSERPLYDETRMVAFGACRTPGLLKLDRSQSPHDCLTLILGSLPQVMEQAGQTCDSRIMTTQDFLFTTIDVFTRAAFGGNPLAVVTDARGLTTPQMQSIASEFNYSETTFVLPPADPAHTARVRIFTPTDEIPFAGHPNVGTAFVLGSNDSVFGRPVGNHMVFEEEAGLVRVEVTRASGRVTGAEIEVPRALEVAHAIDVDAIAACAGLASRDIDQAAFPPVMGSVGLPFAFAQVSSLETLGRAKPDPIAFAEADRRYPHPDDRFSLALFVAVKHGHLRARVFAPLSNIIEDPATGSAAAALVACLVTRVPDMNMRLALTISQGVELGRPSMIEVQADKVDGVVKPVRVRGNCVPIMRGLLTVPM